MASSDTGLSGGRSSPPDLMNDPRYATNSRTNRKPDDVETCRICRGEGTKDEPLFYPCKCSGSIKFVHQECLMEWLSHSQKKHCELCKTPFRFTKLYHPKMPQTLPSSVFLRRAAVHVFRHCLTWIRGWTVFTVWLLCLPWCMRFVWRTLFWLADGGWARDLQSRRRAGQSASEAANAQSELDVSRMSGALRQTLRTILYLGRNTFQSGANNSSAVALQGTNASSNALMQTSPPTSLLSNVTFLNTLTSRPAVNRIVIDIMEGQLITLLVVVAFVLVFLIREWVVQQQPIINLAGVNQEEAAQLEAMEEDALPLNGDDNGAWEDVDSDAEVNNDADAPLHLEEPVIEAPRPGPFQMDGTNESPTADGQQIDSHVRNSQNELAFSQSATSSSSDRQLPRLEDLQASDSTFAEHSRVEANHGRLGDTGSSAPIASTVEDGLDSSSRPRIPARGLLSSIDIRRDIEENDQEDDAERAIEGQSSGPGNRSLGQFQTPINDGSAPSWSAHTNTAASSESPTDIARSDVDPELGSNSTGSWQHIQGDEGSTDRAGLVGESVRSGPSAQPFGSPAHNSVTGAAPLADGNESPAAQPFRPATPDQAIDGAPEPAPVEENPPEPRTILEAMGDWFWGHAADVQQELDPVAEDDEQIVENIAEEPPFVRHAADHEDMEPFEQDADDDALDPAEGDADFEGEGNPPEFGAEADMNGNEAEAVEDAEDLEGILELIGMQGPIGGLFQNALFCAILISATLAGAVFLPYLWGKLVLIFVAHPLDLLVKMPVLVVAAVADFCVDIFLVLGGSLVWWTSFIARLLTSRSGWSFPERVATGFWNRAPGLARESAEAATGRIIRALSATSTVDSDYFRISLDAHTALRSIQAEIADAKSSVLTVFSALSGYISTVSFDSVREDLTARAPRLASELALNLTSNYQDLSKTILEYVSKARDLELAFQIPYESHPTEVTLVHWSTSDRVCAIMAGYLFFCVAGNLYLRRGAPFCSSENGKKFEAVLTDFLQQAGGVLKVILIISIEMILFPLYCGVLLNVALLPLFPSAELSAQIMGTAKISLWWSIFLHWFIGTCYMFHFALFVSMCRKIMRRGVLYFIRDPDDPTFHPVRDVLERNVASQLRKIGFSAMVYGGLVVLCLGGVVWGLKWSFHSVLPIRWTSSSSGREFPIDLLFYNFFTPLAIRFFKPIDLLNAAYRYWFLICARQLRLSDFLFNEQHDDEEGRHVRRTWSAWVTLKQGDTDKPVTGDVEQSLKAMGSPDVYFCPDGRYVRAPSSDTVRIPRGSPVFVEVDRDDNRLDGKAETEGVHRKGSLSTKRVYIPPWFRLRIGAFVFAIWMFAAATGIGVTILPLQIGRGLIHAFSSATVQLNDIYAFSIGAYWLAGTLYLGWQASELWKSYRSRASSSSSSSNSNNADAHPAPPAAPKTLYHRAFSTMIHAGKHILTLVYLYTFLFLALPLLCAAVLELYFLLPLHTFSKPFDRHEVHLLQDWALGVLYIRVVAFLFLRNEHTRLYRAMHTAFGDGPLNPDVGAATRAFILPLTLLFALLLAPPALAGLAANALATRFLRPWDAAYRTLVFRLVYPSALVALLAVLMLKKMRRRLARWKGNIKDEVYLVGERLHNFGEQKSLSPPSQQPQQLVQDGA